jgi:hypothetical protein
MSSESSKYADFHTEFEALLEYAIALLNAQAGHNVQNSRENYGEKIFGKIVCHAISLKRILPHPVGSKDTEIWDISSAYALSRTILESYEALAYVALEGISEEELECRILAWKLHAQERRHKMLSLIGSKDPRISEVEEDIQALRELVLDKKFEQFLPKDVRGKITKGECPSYLVPRSVRLKAANINADYFTAVLMQLSSHVHAHPFSLHQLFDFKAGTPEAYGLMKVAGQYACGFLVVAVREMSSLFAPRIPEPSVGVRETFDLWRELLQRGVKLT